MPLDGTQLDETTQTLIKAKQLLIDEGWCIDSRHDILGRRCALGALDSVLNTWSDHHPATARLNAAIPGDRTGQPWSHPKHFNCNVALYNNAQTSIEPILEWFDRAIAAGL